MQYPIWVLFPFFVLEVVLILLSMHFVYVIFLSMNLWQTFYHFKVLVGSFLFELLRFETSGYLMVASYGLWDIFKALCLSFNFRDVRFLLNFVKLFEVLVMLVLDDFRLTVLHFEWVLDMFRIHLHDQNEIKLIKLLPINGYKFIKPTFIANL